MKNSITLTIDIASDVNLMSDGKFEASCVVRSDNGDMNYTCKNRAKTYTEEEAIVISEILTEKEFARITRGVKEYTISLMHNLDELPGVLYLQDGEGN